MKAIQEAIATNPVLIAALVPIVVYLGTSLGFDVDEGLAATIAGATLVVGSLIARGLVRTRRTLPDPDAVKGDVPPPTTYQQGTPRAG
jgi:hypothetical protein